MATVNKTLHETDAEEMERKRIQDAEAREEKRWATTMRIRVRKNSRGEQDTIYVNLNGHKYMIPRNKEVDVPLPVYEFLMNIMEQEEMNARNAEEYFSPANVPGLVK